MAESKFLKYQDKDGNRLIDVCDEVVDVPEVPCDEAACIPSATAIVPNWQLRQSLSPFLNEKTCHYQVPIETPYTTTIEERLLEEPDLTNDEAQESLNERFKEYIEEAVTAFLEGYNKDDGEASKNTIRDAIIWDSETDYFLEPRAFSRLRLLYSIPYETLDAIEEASPETGDETTSGAGEVTYEIDDLKVKLIHVRKGLKLYSWYNKIRTKMEGDNFYHQSGTNLEGVVFDPGAYGDWGIRNGSTLANLLPQLDRFLNTKGYNIAGVGKFGGFTKDKIVKVIFEFSDEYELVKLTVYTEGCSEEPIIFKDKLGPLKREDAWSDPTAMAYLAQLDDMIADLTAREPLPWVEFIKKYTYPAVESIINQGYTNTDPQESAGSCVADALAQEGKQLGEDILDEVFGLGDAIAAQWHKNLCADTPNKVMEEWVKIGLVYDPDEPDVPKTIWSMALEQTYKTLSTDTQNSQAICAQLGAAESFDEIDDLWTQILNNLKFCGLNDLLMSAIQCLLGGVSFEEGMATIIESALRAMSLENFDKLFIGLPPEKQVELQNLAAKKLESGDIFKESSTLQQTSDTLEGKLDIEKLWDDKPLSEEQAKYGEAFTQGDLTVNFMWGDPVADELTTTDASRRTLAKQYDITNPSQSGASNNVLMEAWIQAYLELFSENYLELLDHLNQFPGAQIVAYTIAILDCPQPPTTNPSMVDFIKKTGSPDCRNTFNVVFPPIRNPFGWLPEKKDFTKPLFDAAKYTIQQTLLKIIVMVMMKVCEVIGNAACGALGAAGASAAALASGGRTKISDAIRDSICGDEVDQEQLDDTVTDMMSTLGLGAAALADTDQVLNFAGDISSAVTTEELYDAFLCEPSAEFLSITRQIIEYEYPDFAPALPNSDAIKRFFCNMGNLMPAAYKDAMNNFLETYPDEASLTSCINICATPEEIEEFCNLRHQILGSRATPDQIDQLCIPNDDLKDLSDIAQGGLPDLPPMVSDPGCDNGILPYEPDEAIAVATAVLGDMLEQLKVDFAYDMLGNGPLKKKWGLMNMVLSDTMGKPLTTHFRKAFNRRPYVDFYMSPGSLDDLTEEPELALGSLADALFPDPPLLKRQKGAFPSKIADWLEDYLKETLPSTITFDSNNELQTVISYTKSLEDAGVDTFRGGIELTRLDDELLGYNTSINVIGDEITFTEEARKLKPDVKLYFQDNCKGLQADEDVSSNAGDAYSTAFNVELYLSELISDDGSSIGAHNRGSQPAQPWSVTSFNDNHSHTYTLDGHNNGVTSFNDNHEHPIERGVVQEVENHTHTLEGGGGAGKSVWTPEFLSLPRDTSRIKIVESMNDNVALNTSLAAMVPIFPLPPYASQMKKVQDKLIPKNSSTLELRDIDKTTIANNEYRLVPYESVKYEFLSVDSTLDGINFDKYPKFVDTFRTKQDYLPQIVLLKEMIEEEGSTLSSAELKTFYDSIMQDLFIKFTAEVATNSDSYEYGAKFDDLSYDDIEYVLSKDLEDAHIVDTEEPAVAGTNYYDVRIKLDDDNPLYELLNGERRLLNKDQILGISKMEYTLSASGVTDRENRVFYLDPLTYGGSYINPPIHIKPLQNKGWLGFVDVMFPEISPCKPYATDLIDFEDIQKKMDDAYPNIPEDSRLQDDPDCAVEVPYNRILDRVAAAGLEGLIAAAIRIYVSVSFIKSLNTFTKFYPKFPEVCSTAYASYIIEEMESSFKNPAVAIFQGPFKDIEFWYAFLEQGVQLYGRRVDDGDIFEPPEDVIDALNRLNDIQEEYEYPNKEELKEERGQMAGLFETLKNYRESKNYEAIQATEADAKLVFKELVIEQLNYMGEKFVKNLEIIDLAPDVYDLDYYLLQYLAQGGEGLNLDHEIVEIYKTLPTVPYEENPGSTGPYYTNGGEFASSDGNEYIGYYHVTTDDEDGSPLYMAGEFHSDAEHDALTPFANQITVYIGDIASYQITPVDSTTNPFIIEKYISINGTKMAPSAGVLNITSQPDQSLNISDVYPGTLELVTDPNGQVVGLTGELGVRYGLQFSVVINGVGYPITTVEVDALDLRLSQVDPFYGDSKLLLCLINMLKEDENFRLIAHYVFPLSKLVSTMAIYNSEAFLPSIGEKVVPVGAVNSSDITEKPGMSIEFDPDEADDQPVDFNYGSIAGWAHPVDRNSGFPSPFVLEWDDWDQVLLRNSKTRIKKIFKSYYYSRTWNPADDNDSFGGPGETPGVIITNEFKEKFKNAPGQHLLPWWKRRMLRTNPFNENGELCESND